MSRVHPWRAVLGLPGELPALATAAVASSSGGGTPAKRLEAPLRLFVLVVGSLATTACMHSATRPPVSESACDPSYERVAVPAFWAPPRFMDRCAQGVTPPISLSIDIHVRLDGSIGAVDVSPESATADCIRTATIGRVLPAPASACVQHIGFTIMP